MDTSFWSDLCQWFKAVIRHWITSVGGPLVAFLQICYGIWRRDWPPTFTWALLTMCFLFATFLAWRDERRKTITSDRRQILNAAVDLLQQTTHHVGLTFVRSFDAIGALIQLADRFQTEEDVEWVARELDDEYGDPFELLGDVLEGAPAFKGKRLKFLQDARVADPPIHSHSEALRYVQSRWAEKNGLVVKDIEPFAR